MVTCLILKFIITIINTHYKRGTKVTTESILKTNSITGNIL